MSEYIRSDKFDTNECPNIFVKENLIRMNVRIYIQDQYIRIFEYIRHTLVQTNPKSDHVYLNDISAYQAGAPEDIFLICE